MHYVRCADLDEPTLALARSLGPMLGAAAQAYLSRAQIRGTEESPHGLTRAEQKLFSILFTSAPQPATYELIYYSMGGFYQRSATLRTAVSVLRRKLGAEYAIKHVSGVGYRMAWEEPRADH